MNPKTKQWVAVRTPYGRGFAVHVRRLDGWEVALFKTYNGLPHDDRMENATLCAAAPDMLEALESLLESGSTDCIGGHDPYPCSERCKTVAAAIRKAKGRP